jgi:hypothetical protein
MSKMQAVPAQGHPDWLPEGVKTLDMHSYDGARGAMIYDENASPGIGNDDAVPELTFDQIMVLRKKEYEDMAAWMAEKGIQTGNAPYSPTSFIPQDAPDVVLDFAEDDVDDNGDIVDEEPEPKKSVGRPRKSPI